ncbi:MAG: transposase [Chloroflexi bacterium]|uniref:Transposase n=1 Tax=Candidatus Chlorohelix allophototropha TaxID=3003348 RepID=A0A8T7M8C8_9CHLR|nr:transposase [Chloroflexota bacterium]
MEQQRARLIVYQLSAYSPDYNPIEYFWRKTMRKATHHKYFT